MKSNTRGYLSGWPVLILLFISWGVTRAVLLADSFSGEVPLDVTAYFRWAEDLTSGSQPALDTAFVYPPGSALVFLMPSFMPPELYFRTFTLLAVLSDLAILISLWLFVRNGTKAIQVAPWLGWLWVLQQAHSCISAMTYSLPCLAS